MSNRGAVITLPERLASQQSRIIKPGNRADLALWKVSAAAELCYQFGVNPLRSRIFAGTADIPLLAAK